MASRENRFRDHPRIRGEHLAVDVDGAGFGGSSPHTRGARPHPAGRRRQARIIPAYAGSTGTRPTQPSPTPDHPRIRGEHLQEGDETFPGGGSSPHTRGARERVSLMETLSRIIPAYAGSTGSCRPTRPSQEDHPRIRGEHCTFHASNALACGSSPHTRGARRPSGRRHGHRGSSPHTRGAQDTAIIDQRSARIIPAYAGSTHCPMSGPTEDRDHPRIRGEHDVRPGDLVCLVGSSPHTRGALQSRGAFPLAVRIIPAYAGSTARRAAGGRARSDHPRIRGEHGERRAGDRAHAGSSPHTRGALDFRPA